MKEIKAYINNEDKSYSEGIDLLKKHSANRKETEFLNCEDHTDMHKKMLIKRLKNILRIAGQKEPAKKVAVVGKPDIVKKQHFSKAKGNADDLEHRKELTNKLIARDWSELDEKEQDYFFNDKSVFDEKKALMIRNSAIESELKTLHSSLPHAESDEQRQAIADQLANLKKEQNSNWSEIDNFVLTEITDKAVDTLKRRNNLRSQIAKLKKAIKDTKHKNYNKRVETLANAEKELKEIEEAI